MSSIEMKNFTNMFCRLIGSLRDSEFICHEFMEDAMQIKASFHRMIMQRSATDPDCLIDDDEVDKLRKENEEMKNLLADYHCGVELLMAAYRERVLDNLLKNNKEEAARQTELFDGKLFETIIEQSEQIYQMHNAMRRASSADADTEYLVAEQMAFLRKENDILKELYEASKKFGTAQNRLRFDELSLREMGAQTDFKVEPKCVDKPNSMEQNQPPCVEKQWEHFDQWKQTNAMLDANARIESEEEDKVTVVDFQTHNKNKININSAEQKNVSSQAYTF